MTIHTIQLPQLSIQYRYPLPNSQHLLVLGGRPPAEDWFLETRKSRTLWAVDHGVDLCYRLKTSPALLIGDGDSSSPCAWKWAESLDIPVLRHSPKKDFTDTQLALQELNKFPESFILLTGAFGGRQDHAFSTILSAAFSGLPIGLADEKEACFFLHDTDILTIRTIVRPKTISLLPLTTTCEKVCIQNVAWPLRDVCLQQAKPYAISNELLPNTDSFQIALGKGCLGVYLYWE